MKIILSLALVASILVGVLYISPIIVLSSANFDGEIYLSDGIRKDPLYRFGPLSIGHVSYEGVVRVHCRSIMNDKNLLYVTAPGVFFSQASC